MSIQAIINRSNSLEMNRRKLVGIQYTRNELSRTSLTPTFNPWRFNVALPNSLRYNDARSIIEEIDRLDRIYPEVISFGDNSNMNWIFRYQGGATTNQLSSIKVQSFVGNQLVLTNLPAINSARTLFAANDLIQIGSITHPFTSTTDVLRGAGSTVTVTTHRPNIIPSSVVNLGITVGANCQFTVFCPNMPTYKLFVGGGYKTNGVIMNNAYIEWSDSFQLYEYLGDLS
jgi:hypothetical protein